MKNLYFLFCLFLIVSHSFEGQSQIYEWARQSGGTSFDAGNAICADTWGNSYVTGFFEGMAVFGSDTLTSRGWTDIFIAKYDSNGTLQWIQQEGGIGFDEGFGITLDNAGNCFITGYFENGAVFGTDTLTSAGLSDVFTAKYNPFGILQWIRKGGGMDEDIGYGIGTDDSGNCYVTGHFSDTVNFDTDMITSAGGLDIFIVKYNDAGSLQWILNEGGLNYDESFGIAVDDIGNCFITGYFEDGAVFGTDTLTSAGLYDVFTAKYNAAGMLQWIKQSVGNAVLGNGIDVDDVGNSYVTGFFSDTANFDGSTIISKGQDDVFVVKYNSSGTLQWLRKSGGTGIDFASGISVDSSGNCYVTGTFEATAVFGTDTLISVGWNDVFIVKYGPSGTQHWIQQSNAGDGAKGYDIDIDEKGNCYITGIFEFDAVFGTDTLTSSGSDDIFIVKLSDEYKDTITDTTSINEFQVQSFKFKVYPNPNRGVFTIEYQTCTEHSRSIDDIKWKIALPRCIAGSNVNLLVYNILGKKIYESASWRPNGPVTINLSKNPAGIYHLQIMTDKGVINEKIIIE